jgi:hypothetical protein
VALRPTQALVISITLAIGISVIGVTAVGIHRFYAGSVVITIIVGNDGCVRRDRVTIGSRTHIIVCLDHAVSGSVPVTSVRIVSTAAACS